MFGKKCSCCQKRVGGLFEEKNIGTREVPLCAECAAKAEEKARREAEEKARREAEEKARREAEESIPKSLTVARRIDNVPFSSRVALSPTGLYVAAGGGDTEKDCSVRVWEVSTGLLLKTLKGHKEYVTGLAFATDEMLVSSSADGKVIFWNATSGSEAYSTQKGQHVSSLTVRGRLLALGGDGGLWVMDWSTRTDVFFAACTSVNCVAISPSMEFVACGKGIVPMEDYETLAAWQLPSKKRMKLSVDACFGDDAEAVTFSSKGNQLFAVDSQGHVIAVSMTEGTSEKMCDSGPRGFPYGFLAHLRGEALVFGSPGVVEIVGKGGKSLARFKPNSSMRAASLCPDLSCLAVISSSSSDSPGSIEIVSIA
jgi:WD40 repeat protein